MSAPVVSAHQPSMTEWFAAIGDVAASEAFRAEDNTKADRLETLFQTIGAQYERPTIFPARQLIDLHPAWLAYLRGHGDELCAIRLVPNHSGLPKLRQRGLPLRETYEQWFQSQAIDPDAYTANVYRHSESLRWSATFVIGAEAVFGEIVRGLHSQLTHGDIEETIHQFRWNYQTWEWSERNAEAKQQVELMLTMLHVADHTAQARLRDELGATFSHDYLNGYFETTVWPDGTTYLIDYNRMLPNLIPTPPPLQSNARGGNEILPGRCAQAGRAEGRVVLVEAENIASIDFPEGAVLVCDNTDVRFLPFMRKAGAIVTNRGGILTHAAIIARELKKPCVIGTRVATKVLKDGDKIEVDATKGIVRKI